MINNLRLVEVGVAEADFRSRFGSGLSDVYPKEMDELTHAGLIEKKTSENSEVFRLTRRGRLLGNQVFMRFLG
jgi:oxygen-independent coproporphyrinogen-3 oxidase